MRRVADIMVKTLYLALFFFLFFFFFNLSFVNPAGNIRLLGRRAMVQKEELTPGERGVTMTMIDRSSKRYQQPAMHGGGGGGGHNFFCNPSQKLKSSWNCCECSTDPGSQKEPQKT